MKHFFEWMTTGATNGNSLAEKLDDAVNAVKQSEEWKVEYMTLIMRDKENFNKGKAEGEKRLGNLINLLLKDGKTDEIQKATSDAGFRNEMYKKYNIL